MDYFEMSQPETIVCKPTRWFLLRAIVITAMFGGLAYYFYFDATTGYPRENAVFYLHKTFQKAGDQFLQTNPSPEAWRDFAAAQTVDLPAEPALLPPEVQPGMKWPAILQDSEQLRAKPWNKLWEEFTATWPHWRMNAKPPEHLHHAGKIREQWIAGAVCAIIGAVAAFVLIRTLGRHLAIDETSIRTAEGKRIPFSHLVRLDLRKWHTKGLAFADYCGEQGNGRIRIDGMTYGGFKKEEGEPAERLMRHLRARFSGELIDYETQAADETDLPQARS
jgi:hypothetical protein